MARTTAQRVAQSALLLSALLGVASAIPFDNAAAYTPLGNSFQVTLTNYGGPYDGTPAEAARSGTGRQYGVLNGGCGYYQVPVNSFPWLSAVAFDPSCPGIAGLPSFACGSCWRFTCVAGNSGCTETKSVVVTVTDICPGCSSKFGSTCHADMHFSAFEKIAHVDSQGGGIAHNVIAERVSCDVGDTSGVTVRVMDNTGPWTWMRVMAWRANGHGIIKRLRLLCDSDGKHESVPHTIDFVNLWGATWELAKQPWGQNCAFEMTDDAGETITTSKVDMSQHRGRDLNRDLNLGIQFSGGAAPPPPPPPPPPPAPPAPTYTQRSVVNSACSDDPPTNSQGVVEYTCGQQAGWGQCAQSWMAGKCNRSCSRC